MRRTRRRPFVSLLMVSALSFVVAGCASLPRTPYGVADAPSARVLNLTDLRRYADDPAATFRQDQQQAVLRGPRTYLALSGGGADGAYGAGVLNGWTEAGTRPSFSIVSGVSTGALIAPFAFLGPGHDATLRDLYTSGVAESLLDAPSAFNAIFGAGLFGNKRLRELVANYIDADFVAAVAAEYAKGRMLFIVTTNLDSQRTAIWDMGRIASLRTPEALNLFRDVVAASASLPVVFPPMLVTAEANGRRIPGDACRRRRDRACPDAAGGIPAARRQTGQMAGESAALHPDQQQGRAGVSARCQQHGRDRGAILIDHGQDADALDPLQHLGFQPAATDSAST